MLHNLFYHLKKREISGAWNEAQIKQIYLRKIDLEFQNYNVRNEVYDVLSQEHISYAARGSQTAINELIESFVKELDQALKFHYYHTTNDLTHFARVEQCQKAALFVLENSVYPFTSPYLPIILLTSLTYVGNNIDYFKKSMLVLKEIAKTPIETSVLACETLSGVYAAMLMKLDDVLINLNLIFNRQKSLLTPDEQLNLALAYAEEGTPEAVSFILQQIADNHYQPTGVDWQIESLNKTLYLSEQTKHYLWEAMARAIQFDYHPPLNERFNDHICYCLDLYAKSFPTADVSAIKQKLILHTEQLAQKNKIEAIVILYFWYKDGFEKLGITPNNQEAQKWLQQISDFRCAGYSGSAIRKLDTIDLPANSNPNLLPRKKHAAALGYTECAIALASSAIKDNLELAEIDKWMMQIYRNDRLGNYCKNEDNNTVKMEELIQAAASKQTEDHLEEFFPYFLKWHGLVFLNSGARNYQIIKTFFDDHLKRSLVGKDGDAQTMKERKRDFNCLIKKVKLYGETTCYLHELMPHINQCTLNKKLYLEFTGKNDESLVVTQSITTMRSW